MGILIIPIFLILMYVALLRPQQQRVRRQQQLVTSIGVGDQIVTAGGLIGRVVGLTDDRLELEVADGVVIELLRMAISRRLEPTDVADDPEGDDEGEMVPESAEVAEQEPRAGHEAAPADPPPLLPPDPDSH